MNEWGWIGLDPYHASNKSRLRGQIGRYLHKAIRYSLGTANEVSK
jgi:hypothetical protein